jgi:hypothetical protein
MPNDEIITFRSVTLSEVYIFRSVTLSEVYIGQTADS